MPCQNGRSGYSVQFCWQREISPGIVMPRQSVQTGIKYDVNQGSTVCHINGAEAIFANCVELDNDQLNEIIEWVRLYQR
ncbi:Uncharacterised protein [Escherichia coli]|nr:Uncharacterised protein [Escherichia coli]SQJ70364.1 Uncharacterised protein [Escherichia coli]SQR07860.1 Uncharacterised protein [Escherichia coli]